MLSIIIPTLNEEYIVSDILECLKKQSFKDFEVILVDGNSNDKTKEIAKKYLKKLDLKVINSEIRNVGYQRNLGVNKSKYDTILFLDVDTSFSENFLEKSIKEFNDHNLKVAGCPLYPDSNNMIDKLFYFLFRNFMFIFYKYIGFNGCCIFVLKELHNKINGFDTSIKVGEDYDYSSRLKEYTKLNMLKNVKIKTSTRRFQKYGRLRTGLKVVAMGLYVLFVGKIRNDIFKYRFNDNLFYRSVNKKSPFKNQNNSKLYK